MGVGGVFTGNNSNTVYLDMHCFMLTSIALVFCMIVCDSI